MSETLLLHFAPPQIGVLEVSPGKGKIHFRRGWSGVLPDDLADGTEAERIGVWLKEQLRTQNIRTRPTTLILPREDLAVRRLELPPARDEELAAMVQMQAATTQSGSDRMVMDFVPFPASDANSGRNVLTASIPKQRAKKLESMVEQAGLQLEAIRISSTALAEVTVREEMRRDPSSDDPSLTVMVGGDRVEMVVVDRRGLVMAHAAESDREEPQRVAAEVSRLLITCGPMLADRRIGRVWLVGAESQGPLGQAIAERVGMTPVTIDPGADPRLHGASDLSLPPDMLAVCCGTAWALADPIIPSADLLHPRQPPVEKSHGKRRGALVAAGAVSLIAVVFLLTRLQQADVNRAIAQQQSTLNDLTQIVERGKATTTAASLVAAWDDRRVNWVDQIARLKTLLPDSRQIYLVNFRVDPSIGEALARVRAGGMAREREVVDAMYQRVSESGFRVYPQPITYVGDNRDYPYRFELHVELPAPTSAAKSATSLTRSPAVTARQGE